ncbi:cupin domain-containing protein [Agromyces aurantiacus]|uniref:Cupin domain-containing protein n=1 Tax=Agromyces aurantiacus TaxID=165814 RepID=A0ABV9R5Y3_9MICO|nr:cupin domain-containing protein [Agromyces aurantiacus]MBM7503403.1 putative cupin superfamily protein [Agromyces aurantiacus]
MTGGDGLPARLAAGAVTDAATLALAPEPVPSDQVVSGAPSTGHAELDLAGGRAVGVWEMSPGAMRDTEADEVFVVLAGRATVEFVDPALPAIELVPGSLVRLDAGMRTVWIVHETLRKVYVAP